MSEYINKYFCSTTQRRLNDNYNNWIEQFKHLDDKSGYVDVNNFLLDNCHQEHKDIWTCKDSLGLFTVWKPAPWDGFCYEQGVHYGSRLIWKPEDGVLYKKQVPKYSVNYM